MPTERLCVVAMLLDAGVTPTVGVARACVTVMDAVPDALLYVAEPAVSGVYFALSVSEPAAIDPAGIEMAAAPETSAVAAEA